MAWKLQAMVDNATKDILDKLERKADKSKFIEMAIKLAYKNPELKEFFSWKDDNSKHDESN